MRAIECHTLLIVASRPRATGRGLKPARHRHRPANGIGRKGRGFDAAAGPATTMGNMIVTGTADGLFEIGLDGAIRRQALPGTEVRAVSGDWATADDRVLSLADGKTVDLPPGLLPHCLLGVAGGGCLVGTS